MSIPSPTLEEQEPGVYVRSPQTEQELEFLWNRERKRTPEQDRFHIGFFAGGFFSGALVTLIGCLIFFSGGSLFPSSTPAVLTEEKSIQATTPQQPAEKAESSKDEGGFSLFPKPKTEETAPTPETAVADESQHYVVQEGDTLGSIALKFYDSSGPIAVERLQKANNMDTPDDLSLGQELIIPSIPPGQ